MFMPFAPGFVEMVMMLIMGSGVGLPLGIPPAPEDPVVSRVAPEECLFYASWSGMAKPDPASRNQTEQLLAEKEVQECLAQLEERITSAVRQGAQNDPEAAALVEPIVTVAKTVLTSPTAVFVSKFDPSGDPRGFRGGAMVNLGDKTTEVEQALAKIEKALPAEPAGPAGPNKWRRIPLGTEGVYIEWAIKGKYLIAGVGEGEADKIVVRARQNPPAWLTDVRRQLVVPRPSSVMYVNVAAILKSTGAQAPPDAQAILEAVGLSRVQSLTNVTGLDDSGCISKTQIAVDGELSGLLSLFTGQPLTKDHLAVIPKDATLAAAVRLDLAKAYKEVLAVAGRMDPRTRAELLSSVSEFEEGLKIKLSQDMFESVGDVWRVYNSPGEGGLVVTGLTAVVNLRDHDRLVAANGKLVLSSLFGGAAKQITAQRRPGGPQISQFKFGEHTIFFLRFPGELMPFAPAWCITDKELVVALFPQNVKAYLSRPAAAASLADVPAVAASFAGQEAPLAVGYADTPGLFKLVYPIAQIIAQMAFSQMQRQGIDLDISVLPSALSIGRHLQPTVVGLRRTQAGVVIETRKTLPVGGGGLALPSLVLGTFHVAPLPMGPGLGNISTPQTTSMNNLKQIMLALHNYHDTMKTFPAAAGPQPGNQKPGQPPVSWRVLILPYVEEMALYQQYRFDEPWDGPNNKKLLARMPAVFKAPGSKVAAQGKTNYLGVVGDAYAFAPDKGRRFAEFTDGTSNTIMVVEASDEKAVPWTKPEDFTPDKTKPIAGLVGLRQGGFLAARVDGSVVRLPAGIDAATLNALFTRAGGEPARWPDEFPGAASPGFIGPKAPPRVQAKVEPPATTESKPAPTTKAKPPAKTEPAVKKPVPSK
ncbi:MAG: DUF1559 family PulG-like putative transporter [Pirellulales bacterium]